MSGRQRLQWPDRKEGSPCQNVSLLPALVETKNPIWNKSSKPNLSEIKKKIENENNKVDFSNQIQYEFASRIEILKMCIKQI